MMFCKVDFAIQNKTLNLTDVFSAFTSIVYQYNNVYKHFGKSNINMFYFIDVKL